MHHKRAFTLIELLVVVSILGLLASIILASLSNAKDRGIVAASVQFADTNYHAYGSDAFAIYNFNTTVGSAPSVIAESMNNFYASCPISNGMVISADSPAGSAGNTSANFVLASAFCTYVSVPATLTLPKYTLTGWIKLTTLNGRPVIVELKDPVSGNSELVYVSTSNKVICKSAVPAFNGAGITSNTVLQLNKWYHVACTFDGTGNLNLYVNGNRDGTTISTASALTWTSSPTINLWRDTLAVPLATGYLDDVMIFSHALALGEIQHLYAKGLKTHQLAVGSN